MDDEQQADGIVAGEQLDYEPLGIWDPSLRQDFSEYLRRYAQLKKQAGKPVSDNGDGRKRFGRKRQA